uniref:DNA repair protein RAD51-like protein 4 n=1 Tax=Dianthus caryophyllus TaxID=3570 RepID=A0A6M4EJA0_DIACA|nr:DNA repair protein RAD51-like protein 4 [Dianthus caryophyllus]
MVLLKTMEHQSPVIDSTFIDFCNSRGILTVEDFLIHDLNSLKLFAEKQFDSERLKQGIDQVLLIVNGLHKPWLNGVELLKDAQENKRNLSLTFEGFNSFLHGGLREGFVTELVGPSSSGKTQACLQAATCVAKGHVGGVVFIDTGNSFSASRIARLISHASCSTSAQQNHNALHNVMKNISCHPVFDIFSLFDVLHQLELKLKQQMLSRQCSVRLLIVDSFSSLIIPFLGGGGPHGHALMVSAGFLLKKIAHEYNVCVLVTNHMVAGEGGSAKPALGESWKTVPHVRLLLSHDREKHNCSISVVKHPSVAAGNQTMFTIHGWSQSSS